MTDQDWPEGLISEILTLLDRIEIEEDYKLSSQRFNIFRKHGLIVKEQDNE